MPHECYRPAQRVKPRFQQSDRACLQADGECRLNAELMVVLYNYAEGDWGLPYMLRPHARAHMPRWPPKTDAHKLARTQSLAVLAPRHKPLAATVVQTAHAVPRSALVSSMLLMLR